MGSPNPLQGRRIIVTGGAGGIGSAAVRAFCAAGARVACTYHKDEPNVPADVATARCDIADKASVDAVIDGFVATIGGLDALFTAAGGFQRGPIEDITPDEWDRVFALNARGTYLANVAAFRHMRSAGGSIINIGSVEGVRGQANGGAYAASRGAVMAWTRSAALAWGRHGVRVNAVAPAVATRLFAGERAALDDAGREAMDSALRDMFPLRGTLGDPQRDLAPVLVFLASDASRFITGQTIAVDGGLMMLGS